MTRHVTDQIALTNGEWRPDHRGILRWVPATMLTRPVDPTAEAERIRCHLAERAA